MLRTNTNVNAKNTSLTTFMYQNESADRKIRLKRTFIGILNQCKKKKKGTNLVYITKKCELRILQITF